MTGPFCPLHGDPAPSDRCPACEHVRQRQTQTHDPSQPKG